MKVKLLEEGGFSNLASCIGKTFEATRTPKGSFRIAIADLEAAGGIVTRGKNADVDTSAVSGTLLFFSYEAEKVEE